MDSCQKNIYISNKQDISASGIIEIILDVTVFHLFENLAFQHCLKILINFYWQHQN